jgi:hypothetical protein
LKELSNRDKFWFENSSLNNGQRHRVKFDFWRLRSAYKYKMPATRRRSLAPVPNPPPSLPSSTRQASRRVSTASFVAPAASKVSKKVWDLPFFHKAIFFYLASNGQKVGLVFGKGVLNLNIDFSTIDSEKAVLQLQSIGVYFEFSDIISQSTKTFDTCLSQK